MPLLHREPGTSETPGAPSGETDAVLVVAAQRDPRDFAALFVRYWDPVLRYCAMRLLNRQDAEDATSQVFVDAYASFHRFRQQRREGSFRAWLFTIAHHEVANRRRYRARHPVGPLTAAADVQDQDTSPEGEAIAAGDMVQIIALLMP